MVTNKRIHADVRKVNEKGQTRAQVREEVYRAIRATNKKLKVFWAKSSARQALPAK